jgi:hypothetical protein
MACTVTDFTFYFFKAEYTTHRLLQLNDASITPRWAKHPKSFPLLPNEAGSQETKPFHTDTNPMKGLFVLFPFWLCIAVLDTIPDIVREPFVLLANQK